VFSYELRPTGILGSGSEKHRGRTKRPPIRKICPPGILAGPSAPSIVRCERPRQGQTRREAGTQSHGPLLGEGAGLPKGVHIALILLG
jgi:hypothetical protein